MQQNQLPTDPKHQPFTSTQAISRDRYATTTRKLRTVRAASQDPSSTVELALERTTQNRLYWAFRIPLDDFQIIQ